MSKVQSESSTQQQQQQQSASCLSTADNKRHPTITTECACHRPLLLKCALLPSINKFDVQFSQPSSEQVVAEVVVHHSNQIKVRSSDSS